MTRFIVRSMAAAIVSASLFAAEAWAQEPHAGRPPSDAQESPPRQQPRPAEEESKPPAEHVGSPAAVPEAGPPAPADDTRTLPNLSARAGWPEPVADNLTQTFALFDLLEYQRVGEVNALRWDFLGWHGGDEHRLWVRSEGELNFESPLGGEADVQVLYGRLISPFFDLLVGGRVEQHYERDSRPTRAFAVVALQGLAPGRFEVEPSLFLSHKGKVSGRFTAALDLYQTQRLILQPRLETEFSFQRDDEFGVERGINDVEIGLRVRYEVSRKFAPYFGVAYRQSLGATRSRVLREGGAPNEVQIVVGVRAWR
jgi:copper resistance protein B